MNFLPNCRAYCEVLVKGHVIREKGATGHEKGQQGVVPCYLYLADALLTLKCHEFYMVVR